LNHVFSYATYQYTSWAINIIYYIAIATIVFLIITYFANARKHRHAYMILGAFFLLIVAIQIPATGKLFRDYNELSGKYATGCTSELGALDHKFVEANGCSNGTPNFGKY